MRGDGMRWKVIGIGLFALVIAWFTLVNATTVSVDFLFVTAKTSLVFVILISVLLGMCLMAILWSARAWKMRRVTKSLKQDLAAREKELAAAHEELADLHHQLGLEADEAADTSASGTLEAVDSNRPDEDAESKHSSTAPATTTASTSDSKSTSQT